MSADRPLRRTNVSSAGHCHRSNAATDSPKGLYHCLADLDSMSCLPPVLRVNGFSHNFLLVTKGHTAILQSTKENQRSYHREKQRPDWS